jgi:bacteriocin-like protein
MTKEISQKDNSQKDQESLVKTSAEGSVELSEKDLQQVAGGQKNKTDQQQYLKIEMENVLVSSYSTSG